jgi:MYXO-CTERM domain-containing protein
VLEADGVTTKSCTPYRCAGGQCEKTCAATSECAASYFCDQSGSCVRADDSSSSEDESGCGCRITAQPSGRTHAAGLLLLALVAARRRARRQRA